MASVFDKLNFRHQAALLVIDAPASFESEIAKLRDVDVVRNLSDTKQVTFALAFVSKQAEVDKLSTALVKKAVGDVLLWFAYPKGTSKTLSSQVNRDQGWDVLRQAGFDTVRQVAIDDDWSALRFRRIEFIRATKYALLVVARHPKCRSHFPRSQSG